MSKVISNSLKFHYDEELFNSRWGSEIDPTSLVLLNSGAVVQDATIASMIAGGGNYYTIPFYKDLSGDPQKYDGATDIVSDDTEDGVQSGVVFGEAKSFKSTIFVNDFTGADPMGNIVARITKYWGKVDQKHILAILKGIFGITGDADWAKHTYNIASSTDAVTDENKIGLTTLRDASVKALGENADNLTLAIMHSAVANRLENLQVLNFFQYNVGGMDLDVKVGRSGNLLVLISDQVPVAESASATGEKEYTTYIFGNGAILTANASVEKPSDVDYDPYTNGGVEALITRRRKTYHPNGFSFAMANMPISVDNSNFENSENWSRQMLADNINIVRVITN
jgi:hypothetical protein